jgi:hypothetical protein
MSVPVPDKRNSADSLENFAKRIEKRLRIDKDKQPFAMERLICRLLANKKSPQVSAMMAHKWVEWRYGKATENVHVTGNVEHTHIDTSNLTDEQLTQIENLIETAHARSDKG